MTRPRSRQAPCEGEPAGISEGAVKPHPPAAESSGRHGAVAGQGVQREEAAGGHLGHGIGPLGCVSDAPEGTWPIDNLLRFFAVLSQWSPEETASKAA